MTEANRKKTQRLVNKALKEFPKVLAKKQLAFKEKQKRMKAFAPLSKALLKQEKLKQKLDTSPIHPWRICPFGQFYRKKHSQKSYTRSNGVQVRGSIHPNECVTNKTGKDQFYAEEIQEIASRNFGTLTNLPSAGILSAYPDESKFDQLVAGWTKYWNEVLLPNDPIDVNFVKALIATESGFKPDSWNKLRGLKRARGLMQVTDESVKLLSNRAKELKDHFVNLTEDDMLDPNLSICAGIRWIFRKRDITLSHDKNATWTDVLLEYKGYKSIKNPQMQKFIKFYDALKLKDKSKLK